MDLLHKFLATPADFLLSYALPFLVVISVLVFVHEWGHYIVARMCGVKIDTFSIGFGKELFGRTDKNGTRWKFSLIPLGGYVQMYGDLDPASARTDAAEVNAMTNDQRKVAFFSQPVGKRAAIVFAGPAINFLFAILILSGLYMVHGQPYTPAIAAKIMEGSAAEQAGIQVDDKIIAVNGEQIEKFEQLAQIVGLNLDTPLTLTVLRTNGQGGWVDEPTQISVMPRVVEQEDRFGFKSRVGRIGIFSPEGAIATRDLNPIEAVGKGTADTFGIARDTLKAIGQMIMGTRGADELGGILRIGAYAGEFAQAGIVSLITFAALLSVNLGLLNLFPIPMLDGGHLAFYAFEATRGKPASEQVQEYALRAGFAMVLMLMVFATWNDLSQLKVFDYLKSLIS